MGRWRKKRYVVAWVAALGALISATTAHAEAPFTADKGQFGGGINFGSHQGDDAYAPNPYGLGVGFDLGYTFEVGVYMGAEFTYFFGSTEQHEGVDNNTNIVLYGLELGFDAAMSPELMVRPKLGLSMATLSADQNGSDYVGSASESGILIPVGLAVLGSIGNGFIGGDFRYAISVDEDADLGGFLFSIGAGIAF